jgi:endonuclease III-like uncharacterized protein
MPGEIAPLIRPSRFYNMKAVKIKNFMDFFYKGYKGGMRAMSAESPAILRKKLLAVKGLGPETVDCILLYACDIPVFVVDAYTKRIFLRYGILKGDPSYVRSIAILWRICQRIRHYIMTSMRRSCIWAMRSASLRHVVNTVRSPV